MSSDDKTRPDPRAPTLSLLLGQLTLVELLVKKGVFSRDEYNKDIQTTADAIELSHPEASRLVRMMKLEGGNNG